MINNRLNYIMIPLFVLVCVVIALTAGMSSMIDPPAGAVVTVENNYDKTDIEDDLADVDLTRYPKNPNGTPQVFEFVEYCYSDNAFKQGNYGLYLYVYNPAQIQFSMKTGANTVSIAVKYEMRQDKWEDGKQTHEPTEYANLSLTYLDKSEGEHAELFYKFKITDPSALLANAKANAKDYGERRYDVSGIQLCRLGSNVKTDYTVGGSWRFTGYAKGYGTETENTLVCEKKDLETVELDVHYTFYRPDFYNNAENFAIKDQLNAVYFSVPERLFDTYGDIYSIMCEWYEYQTQPIWVLSDSDAYRGLLPYVGQHISGMYDDGKGRASSTVNYGLAGGLYPESGNPPSFWTGLWDMANMSCKFAYNMRSDFKENVAGKPYLTRPDILYNLYYASTDKIKDYAVSGTTLKADWEKYSEGKTDLILDKYARELFTEDVGSTRTAGYNKLEVKSSDTHNLTSVALNDNWFTRLFGVTHGDAAHFNGIKAVETIEWNGTEDDNADNKAAFCIRNYIDPSTFDEFAAVANAAKANVEPQRIVMLRFATTEYKVVKAVTYTYAKSDNWLFSNSQANFVAQENVFLDFDVIQLTFRKDGEFYVIPVVADPIDGIGGIDGPPIINTGTNCTDAMKTFLMVVLIVLGAIVVIKLISWIVRQFSRPKSTVNVQVVQGNGSKKRKKRKRR